LQKQEAAQQAAQQSTQAQQQDIKREKTRAAVAAREQEDARRTSTPNPFASTGVSTNAPPAMPLGNNPFASSTESQGSVATDDGALATSVAGRNKESSTTTNTTMRGSTNSKDVSIGSHLVVGTDVTCYLKVDYGQPVEVVPKQATVIRLAVGEHLLTAVTHDGRAWHSVLTVDGVRNKAILISLQGQRPSNDPTSPSIAELAAEAKRRMRDTAARSEQQTQLIGQRAQAVANESQERRTQIAHLQSRISDLRAEQETDQEAAQNFDLQAELSQPQCIGLPTGDKCYGQGVSETGKLLALQKRQEVQRLQLEISELQDQLQGLTKQ
jgi:hypothetical protein